MTTPSEFLGATGAHRTPAAREADRYRPYPPASNSQYGTQSSLPATLRGSIDPMFSQSSHSGAEAPGVRPAVVDIISNHHNLSGPQRMEVHRFAQDDPATQNVQIFAQLSSQENQLGRIETSIEKLQEHSKAASKSSHESWTAAKWQKELMQEYACHYLTHNLPSFANLYAHVEAFIDQDPALYGLPPNYREIPVLRGRVVTEMRDQSNNAKSKFKKAFDKAAKSNKSLAVFTDDMLRKHRQGHARGTALSFDDKALFATYRDLAYRLQQAPLCQAPVTPTVPSNTEEPESADQTDSNNKGRTLRADSGYWKQLDDECEARTKSYKNDKNKWDTWKNEIVALDEERFGIEPTSRIIPPFSIMPHIRDPVYTNRHEAE
ncbi:hypothetical protein FRC09_000017 [Ceratobasidium sp. 395]|nr:hypothetical protein FRC09_000017 [Ceratobasidium sp. 395]